MAYQNQQQQQDQKGPALPQISDHQHDAVKYDERLTDLLYSLVDDISQLTSRYEMAGKLDAVTQDTVNDLVADCREFMAKFKTIYRFTMPVFKHEYPNLKLKMPNSEVIGIMELCQAIEQWHSLSLYQEQIKNGQKIDIASLYGHGVKLFDMYLEALSIAKIYVIKRE